MTVHKAKGEKPNPKLTGRRGKKIEKSEGEGHERWDTDGYNSVMKEVQLLKACLSSGVNMMEPILKTSIAYRESGEQVIKNWKL